MRISYNPITSEPLLEAPSNNDITFDLRGLNIFVKGTRFRGTDTTYLVFRKSASQEDKGYDGLVPYPSYTPTNVRFLREDGTWQLPQTTLFSYILLDNTDLNDLKIEGTWYYIPETSNIINGPLGVTDGAELYIGRNSNNSKYQKIILKNGIIWFRIFNGTDWDLWIRHFVTDENVSQVLDGSQTFRPVVLGYTNEENVELFQDVVQKVYTTTSIYVQPSTGSLWANRLYSEGKPVLVEHLSLENYVTLDTLLTITGIKTFLSQPLFLIAQDLSPFLVQSNVVVTNLNADLLDGIHAEDFLLKLEELTNNLVVINKNLDVTQLWMDTGIQGDDLPANGTYIILVYVEANENPGNMYNCYNSGVISWYKNDTSDFKSDEILLHRAGQSYSNVIYLRTVSLVSGKLKLLISSNTSIGKEYIYTFKFKRVI